MSNKIFWLVVKIPNFIVSRLQQNDRIGAMFGGNIHFFYSVFIKRVSYLLSYILTRLALTYFGQKEIKMFPFTAVKVIVLYTKSTLYSLPTYFFYLIGIDLKEKQFKKLGFQNEFPMTWSSIFTMMLF